MKLLILFAKTIFYTVAWSLVGLGPWYIAGTTVQAVFGFVCGILCGLTIAGEIASLIRASQETK